MIVFASVSKPFFTTSNLSNVLLQASATAIAAVGMTFVILIGRDRHLDWIADVAGDDGRVDGRGRSQRRRPGSRRLSAPGFIRSDWRWASSSA